MNKKEIAEIRKTFTHSYCAIDAITGCFVTQEKEIKPFPTRRFSNLPEEEGMQYVGIFQKILTGRAGVNLNTLDFPILAEAEGTTHSVLMGLRDNLNNPDLLNGFYSRIVETYEYPENYCMLIAHCVYDIPNNAETVNDEVYTFLACCICPVTKSKTGLSYSDTKEEVVFLTPIQKLGKPAVGFTFPCFHSRSTDIHSVLVYTQKQSYIDDNLILALLGCTPRMSAKDQEENFLGLVNEAYKGAIGFESAIGIQSKLGELYASESLLSNTELDKNDVYVLLEEIGNADLKNFNELYSTFMGNSPISLESLKGSKKLIVETGDITITGTPESADFISVNEVNGQRCIVIIPNGKIKVNGLSTIR